MEPGIDVRGISRRLNSDGFGERAGPGELARDWLQSVVRVRQVDGSKECEDGS